MAVPAGLLQECRGDLTRARRPRAASTIAAGSGMADWFRDLLHHGIPLRIPVSAMALIAVGYFAARLTGPAPLTGSLGTSQCGPGKHRRSSRLSVRLSLSRPERSASRSMRSTAARSPGALDDEKIQRLLLAAIREENNPGVRVESVGMLKECAQSSPVRAALLDAVAHDPNAGVRLKALEGLKAFAGRPGGAPDAGAGAVAR